MNMLYDPSRGTVAGIPATYLFVFVGVLAFILFRKMGKPIEAVGDFVGGVLDVITPGENKKEKAANEVHREKAKKMLSKTISHGQPTARDRAKADELFLLMDGYFNQKKVKKFFGNISNKKEMNRVYTAFDIRYIIHGGVTFLRVPIDGDIIAHMVAYGVDLHEEHKREDGTSYTIMGVLDWIGG